jgi:hypothetical protein
MRMLEELRKKQHAIATIGERERAKARSLGISSFYTDPSLGEGIVEEKPDGTKILHDHFVMTKPGMHAAE